MKLNVVGDTTSHVIYQLGNSVSIVPRLSALVSFLVRVLVYSAVVSLSHERLIR